MELKYSLKFYWGIILISLSLILGFVSKITFIFYFYDSYLQMLSAVIYLFSWPLLILGVWWVGKEYADSLRRYFQYHYYHEHLKRGSHKIYDATKALREKTHEKALKIKEKVRDRVAKRSKK